MEYDMHILLTMVYFGKQDPSTLPYNDRFKRHCILHHGLRMVALSSLELRIKESAIIRSLAKRIAKYRRMAKQ